jgi:UDP:flavonoid glycosyltransferase YjiC (YdhE family)
MRVLFTIIPGHGHLNKIVPLARGLERAGHEVAVATSATACQSVRAAGLTALVAGVDWSESAPERLFPQIATMSMEERAGALLRIFSCVLPRPMMKDVRAHIRARRPDVMVIDRVDRGGMLAAEVEDVPYAVLGAGSMGGSLLRASSTEREAFERAAGIADYMRLRTELGLPGDFDDARDRWLVLDQLPPSLHMLTPGMIARTAHPVRPVPWNLSPPDYDASWSEQLPLDRPIVLLTVSSVFGNRQLTDTILRALCGVHCTVVASVGTAADLDRSLGSELDLRMFSFVPHDRLIPRCDLVITQGGWGTVIASLAAGVPMLLLPAVADQPFNALRVRSVGAGRFLPPDRIDAASVRAEVERLLSEDVYRRSAQRLAEEIRAMPSLERGVSLLELLARERRPMTTTPELASYKLDSIPPLTLEANLR